MATIENDDHSLQQLEEAMPTRSKRKTFWQYIPLLVGLLLLYAIYRDINFSEILVILVNDISWWWFVASIVVSIVAHITRARLWQLLLRPIGLRVPLKALTHAVFVNYGANLLFPRLGDFLRPALIARRQRTSFSTLLGSIVTERIIDILLVLLMIIPALFVGSTFFISFYQKYPTSFATLQHLFTSYWFYLALAIVVLSLFFLCTLLKDTLLLKKVRLSLRKLIHGVGSIFKLERPFEFVAMGILVWTFYFLQLYFCAKAFPFTADLSFGSIFMVYFMSCLAGIVPIQGGIGPWHFAVISTLFFYGVTDPHASAFALIVHTSQTLLNGVLGVYGYLQERHHPPLAE